MKKKVLSILLLVCMLVSLMPAGAAAYAEVYGELMAKCVDENSVFCDIITWVPLNAKRLRRRGYDQARLIAEETAKLMGVECVQLLTKTRNIRAQSLTGGAAERKRNVSGVYSPCDTELIKGRHVLIIDDIVTTGATLAECAGVLTKCGAASVTAATLARKRA